MRFGRHILHPLPGRIDLEIEFVCACACVRTRACRYSQLTLRIQAFGKVLWKWVRWCIHCLGLWSFCVLKVCRESRCRLLGLPEQLAAWLRWNPADGFTGLNISYWETPLTIVNSAGHLLWGPFMHDVPVLIGYPAVRNDCSVPT